MFNSIFSKNIFIPTIKLSGIIGHAGAFRSGMTIESLNKIIEKAFSYKKAPAVALIIDMFHM